MWPLISKPKGQVSTQEAYTLWDMLSARYSAVEGVQIFQNFIHDKDFKELVKFELSSIFEDQINELEKTMNNFGIGLPRRPPKSVRTPVNNEAIEDRFVASFFMTLLQDNVSLQLRGIRTSLTNDNVRKLFIQHLKDELKLYDKAIKYFKLKGWGGSPPIYPQAPAGSQEKLDSGEAFHVWDHLTSRYDCLEITQIYQSFVHDPDFKSFLSMGQAKVLEKQINILEQEMDHFGLPLPQRPPKSAQIIVRPEVFEDELMYRQIFTGMQFMLNLHAVALKQNLTNDRLRKVYIDFLWEEISLVDTWIKYGKAKGWLRPVPAYQMTS